MKAHTKNLMIAVHVCLKNNCIKSIPHTFNSNVSIDTKSYKQSNSHAVNAQI